MVRSMVAAAVVAVVAWGAVSVRADDLGPEIDLTAFGQMAEQPAGIWDDLPLEDVARRFGTAPRRFYMSGMIGPSFASVNSPGGPDLISDDTLSPPAAPWASPSSGNGAGSGSRSRAWAATPTMPRFWSTPAPSDVTLLTNNWSVMNNLWRDLMLTERFGIYGGGGIGAGGYILGEQLDGEILYADPAANFAWQFGGGLLWEISDRLTFDVGYRYFHIDTITQPGVEPNQFSASELMFTLRLYEPFRSWRR